MAACQKYVKRNLDAAPYSCAAASLLAHIYIYIYIYIYGAHRVAHGQHKMITFAIYIYIYIYIYMWSA